jgi:DNA-binding winged helix-turn-helix (wHTH) protein
LAPSSRLLKLCCSFPLDCWVGKSPPEKLNCYAKPQIIVSGGAGEESCRNFVTFRHSAAITLVRALFSDPLENMKHSEEVLGALECWTPTETVSGCGTLQIGSWLVNLRTREATGNGVTRRLRRKEVDLLVHLNQKAGAVFSRDELLRNVWHAQRMVTRTIDQTVATLRRKLGENAEEPKLLLTVYGVGYRLAASDSSLQA